MIRSDLLVHEARIGLTRGCVGGVSRWVKFYTQDRLRFCRIQASRYGAARGSIPAVLVLWIGISGVLVSIGSLWWVTVLLMRLPVGDLAFSGLGLRSRSRLCFDLVKDTGGERGLHSMKHSDI